MKATSKGIQIGKAHYSSRIAVKTLIETRAIEREIGLRK